MAIYTMENFSMLTAKPLDDKRVMTYNQWDADDIGGLSYPGQLYYDPETGWFRANAKYVDDLNNTEQQVFGVSVDGVYIGNDKVCVSYGSPEIIMYFNNNMDPIISMLNSDGNQLYYSGNAIDYEDIDYHIISSIDFSKSEILFGNSNTITSNTNNKVVTMIGTGLTTNADPEVDQFIIGKYNIPYEYNLFEIGDGTSDNNRKNVFEIESGGLTHIESLVKYGDGNTRDIMGSVVYSTINHIKDLHPTVSSNGAELVTRLPINCIVDKVIIEITEAFEDGELLDVFVKDNSTNKKYIIKDYPISKIPVGSLAIENMFVHLLNCTEIHVWRHGIDYTKLPGYTETLEDTIYGDFSGEANIHISTAIPSELVW